MLNQTFVKNNKFKILSTNGFVNFDGLLKKDNVEIYRVIFYDGSYIDVSFNHKFFTPDMRDIYTHELSNDVEILSVNGTKKVKEAVYLEQSSVIDVINSENHMYISNDVISHNCQFLSSDALLIDSIILNNIVVGELPNPDFNGVYWFEQPKENQLVLIGVDPSTGTGGDISSIEIFSFPDLIQLGEFRSNTTSSVELYRILKSTIKTLERKKCSVYFSIENNGVGEGLISLYQNDENPTDGYLISEEGKKRYGMTTTGKSKLKACITLKELITHNKIKINSKFLLSELKGFVRKQGSYAAQYGSTDDSISAVLIIMRILEEMTSFEDEAQNILYSYNENRYENYEEYDENDNVPPVLIGDNLFDFEQKLNK